ncbi:MAG: nitroreductase family protein [Parabacteroides sp.]
MTIQIDADRCIRCGKCARVCPDGILVQERAGDGIQVVRMEHCIGCGHCVDVCPEQAVQHSAFPPEKLHRIDYAKMPSSEQVMALLKSRRSNRTLTGKPIPFELLKQIVEAANAAPTATNSQLLSYTLVTDPVQLRWVADFTIRVFDQVANLLLNPVIKCLLKPFLKELYAYAPMFKQLKADHEAGKGPVLRHASALLFITTPKSNRFGSEDANLAYQNGSIMAQSLGISQIYMGFVLSAIQQKPGVLEKHLGLQGRVKAIMALGYPAFRYTQYADRKPISLHVEGPAE